MNNWNYYLSGSMCILNFLFLSSMCISNFFYFIRLHVYVHTKLFIFKFDVYIEFLILLGFMCMPFVYTKTCNIKQVLVNQFGVNSVGRVWKFSSACECYSQKNFSLFLCFLHMMRLFLIFVEFLDLTFSWTLTIYISVPKFVICTSYTQCKLSFTSIDERIKQLLVHFI